MDNDDLLAAFIVLFIIVLLWVYQPDLSQRMWIP